MGISNQLKSEKSRGPSGKERQQYGTNTINYEGKVKGEQKIKFKQSISA